MSAVTDRNPLAAALDAAATEIRPETSARIRAYLEGEINRMAAERAAAAEEAAADEQTG